jgi:hypothetical protein
LSFQRLAGSLGREKSTDNADKENDEQQQQHDFRILKQEKANRFGQFSPFCHIQQRVNHPISHRLKKNINCKPGNQGKQHQYVNLFMHHSFIKKR